MFCGKNSDGIKINDIKIIPKKKNMENKKFLIIKSEIYIKSFKLCLLLIIWTLDFLIRISVALGLRL